MKQCPTCKTRYPDAGLVLCDFDGTELIDEGGSKAADHPRPGGKLSRTEKAKLLRLLGPYLDQIAKLRGESLANEASLRPPKNQLLESQIDDSEKTAGENISSSAREGGS